MKPREDIWYLRAAAVMWLRYDQQCPIVSIERGPWRYGVPDVLGIKSNRFYTEIEIKRSMSDFRNNRKKEEARDRLDKLFARTSFANTMPQPLLFYFFVTPDLIDRAIPLLKDGQGLIALPDPTVDHCLAYRGILSPRVVVRALNNDRARRLNVRQCVQAAKNQSGTLSSLLCELAKHANRAL